MNNHKIHNSRFGWGGSSSLGQRQSAFYDLAQIRTGSTQDPAVYGSDIVIVDTSGSKSFFNNFSGGLSSGLGFLGMLMRPW